LEVIDDDEVKFEEKECVKELQVETKSITLDLDSSLACTHHKLNFEAHRSKICYFVNILAIMLYLKYSFFLEWKSSILDK